MEACAAGRIGCLSWVRAVVHLLKPRTALFSCRQPPLPSLPDESRSEIRRVSETHSTPAARGRTSFPSCSPSIPFKSNAPATQQSGSQPGVVVEVVGATVVGTAVVAVAVGGVVVVVGGSLAPET